VPPITYSVILSFGVSSGNIPHSLAIANAVWALSPVIILTVIPAFWHLAIESLTVSLNGSWIPTIPYNI